jgi:hypothetical protein
LTGKNRELTSFDVTFEAQRQAKPKAIKWIRIIKPPFLFFLGKHPFDLAASAVMSAETQMDVLGG